METIASPSEGCRVEWIDLLESCFEAVVDRPADAADLEERLSGITG